MKENKKTIILSIIGVIVLIASILGVTYAWFSSNIDGDGAEFNVTTATVGPLTYTGTEITASGILPGWMSEDATLTVEGTVTGSEEVEYVCTIENTGEVLDIEYRISTDGAEDSTNATWTSIEVNPIVTGSISANNVSDTYKLAIRFKETGLDQNSQQNKELSVNVTCNILETYEVVVTSTDNTLGTVSMTSNTIAHGSSAVVTLLPTTGYMYSSDTCEGVRNGNTLTISNVTSPITCTVTFEKSNILYERILADNPNISTRPSFNAIYTTSNNGNTIYEADGQDGAKTYYFAGSVTNNYVKFTGVDGSEMWWRIIRINEDNSVRLLYYGTNSSGENIFPSTSQAFNTTYSTSIYAGYEYESRVQHGTGINSSIKDNLESWYTSNLASYDTYISRTAIYCNDRTVESGTWVETGTTFYYAGYTRLFTNKTPTFECANETDKFTGSTITGNGVLSSKPIGLITADEVAYAGGVVGINNASYYISENATDATYWWTMTPYDYNGGSHSGVFMIGGSSSIGRLNGSPVNVAYGMRPVISLKSCVNWTSGNGTEDSPYEVNVNSTCEGTEN